MQTQTNYTGIDISKSFFDVAIQTQGKYTCHKLGNDETGFKALLALLKKLGLPAQVVMEASGPYYLGLACCLHGHGIGVSVVNPLVIRRFCQMRMSRAKTDKKDAVMIAEYGKTEKPSLWQPPQRHVVMLQQMSAFLTGLNKEHTALNNQLESFLCSGMLDKTLKRAIEKELAHKAKLIRKVTDNMQQIAELHYTGLLANLQSIPGMGKKTSVLLAILSGGFNRFDDYRKLSSYIGLCPRTPGSLSRAQA